MRNLWAKLPDGSPKRYTEGTGGAKVIYYRELEDGQFEVLGVITKPEVVGNGKVLRPSSSSEIILATLPAGTTFEYR